MMGKMTEKRSYVFGNLKSGDVCVFPSEVAARYWAQQYVLQTEDGALRSDHAISWDTFVSLLQSDPQGRKEADDLVRLLFVELWGKAHAFSYYHAGAEESLPRLERYLATILPQLADVTASEAFLQLDPAMQQDLRSLHQGYVAFLQEKGMYEPSYQKPVNQTGLRYRVLFADCLPGASRILCGVQPEGSVRVIPSPPGKPEGIVVYDNHVQEIRSTLRAVRALLDEGVPVDSIIIATANSSQMMPVLQLQAPQFDVPLSLRYGQNPLEHPAGRFLLSLGQVYTSQFLLDDLKGLLLDPALPWSDEQLAVFHRFLAQAVEDSVDRGSTGTDDLWIKNLKDSSLVAWYKKFKTDLKELNDADTVDRLTRLLHGFQDRYFRPGGWKGFPGEERYTFCMDTLEAIGDSMQACGVETHPGMLSLLVSVLGKRRYVAQSSGEEGVHVYRWTDANALDVPHAFYLAMDWKGTQVVDKPLDCLPDTIAEEARQEENLTDANIRLVAMDGAVISYNRRDYGGDHRAPSAFSRELEPPVLPDVWKAELSLWEGETVPMKGSMYQQASRNAYLSKDPHAARFSLEGNPFPDDLASLNVDHWNVSPTALDQFVKCPFAWCCQYLFGVTEMRFLVNLVDEGTIGSMLHLAYRKFFSSVGRFDRRNIPQYRTRLETCFDESMVETYKEEGPDPAGRAWIVTRFRDAAVGILEKEAELFDGKTTVETEGSHKISWEDGISLSGRIDRVVDMGDGTMAVIDYKKSKAPLSISATARNKPESLPEKFTTLQLPLYRALIEQSLGKDVSWAGYYVIQDGKYVAIWSNGDDPAKEAGSKRLENELQAFRDALRHRSFPATPSDDACKQCAYRPVCRRRFSAQ